MKKIFIGLFMSLAFLACAQNNDLFHRWQTRNFTLYLLSEGQQQGNKSILLNVENAIIEQYTDNGNFQNAVNAFLVTMQNGKNILVDAGFGKKLFEHLNNLNIKPEQIDYVLLTHMHGDHIGGLLKEGKPTFPNAQIYLSQAEFDYWSGQNNKLAKDVLEKYKSQIHLFTPQDIDKCQSQINLNYLLSLRPLWDE